MVPLNGAIGESAEENEILSTLDAAWYKGKQANKWNVQEIFFIAEEGTLHINIKNGVTNKTCDVQRPVSAIYVLFSRAVRFIFMSSYSFF